MYSLSIFKGTFINFSNLSHLFSSPFQKPVDLTFFSKIPQHVVFLVDSKAATGGVL